MFERFISGPWGSITLEEIPKSVAATKKPHKSHRLGSVSTRTQGASLVKLPFLTFFVIFTLAAPSPAETTNKAFPPKWNTISYYKYYIRFYHPFLSSFFIKCSDLKLKHKKKVLRFDIEQIKFFFVGKFSSFPSRNQKKKLSACIFEKTWKTATKIFSDKKMRLSFSFSAWRYFMFSIFESYKLNSSSSFSCFLIWWKLRKFLLFSSRLGN